MTNEILFRLSVLVILASAGSISGHFRKIARTEEAISRKSEETSTILLRLLVAGPLFFSFLAYLINPNLMQWAAMALPSWLRWIFVGAGLGASPLVYWIMVSIGTNISETVLTKKSHQLITIGPYKWVRHPLYSGASLMLLSLSFVAANWFMLAMTMVALVGIAGHVLPKEEAELVEKFGNDYRFYRKQTGRLLPRIFGP